MFTTLPSLQQEWMYVSLLPLHFYEEKLDNLNQFLFIFFAFGLFTAILISLIIAYKTYQPVKKIALALEQQQIYTEEKGSKNPSEINFIINNIASTINSNQQLEQELERRLERLNKAQSLALQSQISPHFLFNTLESINWKAIHLFKGRNEVSDMVESLARLMQESMESQNYLIPLHVEIEHLKRYLAIIQYRFKDLITIHWKIDQSLLNFKVNKLSLQPLIENAIKHGINPKRQNGDIWITIEDAAPFIRIEVKDNGAGVNREKQKMIQQRLNDIEATQDEHIGLQNVNQRLKLIFGETYGLTIESIEGQETILSFTIPKVD